MKEFLEKYKNKGVINRDVLNEFNTIMEKEEFDKSFKKYKKNNKKLDILNGLKNQFTYKKYIEEFNIIEIRSIVFYVTKEILIDAKVDVIEVYGPKSIINLI